MRRIGAFPVAAFCMALILGGGLTSAVWLVETQRAQVEFERIADVAIDRVITRLEKQVVLLQSARGLFSARNGDVDRTAFQRFLAAADLDNDLSGIQGVGFARMIAADGTAAAADEIYSRYGFRPEIRPDTQQAWRAVIVLIEPQNRRNVGALGFDMYQDDVRRRAMDHAIASGAPQMTGPVELVQEITADKQTGFLIYLAFDPGASPPAQGFVYAPFRGGDLVRAALAAGPPLPVALTVRDTGAPDQPIYTDGGVTAGEGLMLRRTVQLVGRQWSFEVREAAPTRASDRHLGSLLVGLISLLFAAATGYAVAARQQEAEQAREVASAAAREAEYRGLLLQEMKHRIKNHIARIQSIARQSARGATDVRAFTESFDARLQAMAAVQEILAGTVVPQAEVRAILRKELQQCLDTDAVEHLMDGPAVRLDERQAHAFAMVAHELVTNALKYGGLSARGEGLKITWSVLPPGDDPSHTLYVDWVERFAPAEGDSPASPGFGSRLIEASLRGELSGSLIRDYGPDGLRIAISFPLPQHKTEAPEVQKRR